MFALLNSNNVTLVKYDSNAATASNAQNKPKVVNEIAVSNIKFINFRILIFLFGNAGVATKSSHSIVENVFLAFCKLHFWNFM